MSIRSGKASRYRSFTVGEKIAAVEASTNIEDRSSAVGPPSSSRASIIGRAMASPVIDTVLTRSRSIVRHTSAGSNCRPRNTTRLPSKAKRQKPHWAAPCMSGGRFSERHPAVGLGRLLGQRPLVGHPLVRVGVDAAAEGEEHVLVAPHDALGHAGRAAGVDDVVVVVRARAEVAVRATRRHRVLERHAAERASTSSAALGSVPSSMWIEVLRAAGATARTASIRGAELAVEDQRLEVGVVEQVAQLLLDVPVVHVHRHGPDLVGGQRALDPLDAVGAVDPDVVARRRCPAAARWWASRLARASSWP